MDLHAILKRQIETFSPDTHLQAGFRPYFRNKNGEIVHDDNFPDIITNDELANVATQIMGPEKFKTFAKEMNWDGSYTVSDISHFRVNAAIDRHGINLDFRAIPEDIPSFEELGLTETVREMALRKNGLILVTGPNGHGKSTTLASMIDYLNENKPYHIMTIEDPIEFIYTPKKSLITQREIGTHTSDFFKTLKHVVRQDVSLIVVGEMRDLETVAATITLAETGHLVLATLHTQDAKQTIERILDIFPPEQQQQIRIQLSLSLKGIICQQLIPRADGKGRVAARETILVDDGIANLIREDKIQEIPSHVQVNRAKGMVLFDDDVYELYNLGIITEEMAITKANDSEEMRLRISTHKNFKKKKK